MMIKWFHDRQKAAMKCPTNLSGFTTKQRKARNEKATYCTVGLVAGGRCFFLLFSVSLLISLSSSPSSAATAENGCCSLSPEVGVAGRGR
ncbi:hypothetical protein ACOSQ4_014744 [Xanthoceras sorbifolium]